LDRRVALEAVFVAAAINLKMVLKFTTAVHIVQRSTFEYDAVGERLAKGVVELL
jgi:hypothetical protein